MKRYQEAFLPSSVVLVIALIIGYLGVATAGVEPSPFQPEINQLGAAENLLVATKNRVVKTMDAAPSPEDSQTKLTSSFNRLDAIDRKLVSVDDMVASIIEEVMGVEPSPFHPLTDVVPAIAGVDSAAAAIVEEIDARLGVEPSPFLPAFEDSLQSVKGSAQTISNHAEGYIQQISCDVDCMAIETRTECEAYVCCVWIATDNLDPDVGSCEFDVNYTPGL